MMQCGCSGEVRAVMHGDVRANVMQWGNALVDAQPCEIVCIVAGRESEQKLLTYTKPLSLRV